MCRPTVLKGRDDHGICKSGYLWKQTAGSFKRWKPYFFVVSRLCLLCFRTEDGLLDGSGLKFKVDLHSISDIHVVTTPGKKQGHKEMKIVISAGLLSIKVKCSSEDEAMDWCQRIQEGRDLCRKRREVLTELQRAAFMRNVESNLKHKLEVCHPEISNQDHVPKVTYLRRVSSCESLVFRNHLKLGTLAEKRSRSLDHLSLSFDISIPRKDSNPRPWPDFPRNYIEFMMHDNCMDKPSYASSESLIKTSVTNKGITAPDRVASGELIPQEDPLKKQIKETHIRRLLHKTPAHRKYHPSPHINKKNLVQRPVADWKVKLQQRLTHNSRIIPLSTEETEVIQSHSWISQESGLGFGHKKLRRWSVDPDVSSDNDLWQDVSYKNQHRLRQCKVMHCIQEDESRYPCGSYTVCS